MIKIQEHRTPKKIRKTFTNKKQLIKYLLDAASDLDQYTLEMNTEKQQKPEIKVQEMFPLRFSDKLIDKDQIILSDNGTVAGVNSDFYTGGDVALDFKLKQKTSWQLKFYQGVQVSFGICQINNNRQQGLPALRQEFMITSAEKYNDFMFQQGNLINLTYDPCHGGGNQGTLNFFNTNTLKRYLIKIPPKSPDCEYYPVVHLHKASVHLMMDYLLQKARKQAHK